MAKSKSGGTRSYLRGKIGSDVYQNGKDGKGAKQQVVRSLAEVVDNPRSLAQMRSRMCMSSVAQLMRALRPIIDHSFDGVPKGQPSISHFRSLAMQAYMEDAASASPKFGYVGYGEKYVPNGNIVVSQGKAMFLHPWWPDIANQSSSSYNHGGFHVEAAIGRSPEGDYSAIFTNDQILEYLVAGDARNYITWILIGGFADSREKLESVKLYYARMRVDLSTWPSMTNREGATLYNGKGLIVEGNFTPELNEYDGQYALVNKAGFFLDVRQIEGVESLQNFYATTQALILSKYVEGKGYFHSTSSLEVSGIMKKNFETDPAPFTIAPWKMTMEEALATYPQGAARFLNGGEI